MCPPAQIAPAAEINEYWTDEGVFKSLMKYQSGCRLPLNVTSDVNPYQFRPSDLPEDLWYYCSGVKKDTENGFWMAMGEACEIFSNSAVIGLRTTLQFYEGQAPHGQKTNWMMQEYTTKDKYNSKQDPRALCRVFLADENKLGHPELPSAHCIADIDVKNSIGLGPNIVSNANSSGQLSNSEPLENNTDNGAGPLAVAQRPPHPPLENSPDVDYVLGDFLELNDLGDPLSRSSSSADSSSPDVDYVMGDFLELNDLGDPLSRSSSSADSSCLTMTSEEYFDSIALLRELEDDTTDQEMKDSSVKFNLSTSVKSKEVVMHPATLGSLKNGEEYKPSMEETSQVDHAPRNEQGESSSSEGTSKEENKDHVGRTKRHKMLKYFCFMAF